MAEKFHEELDDLKSYVSELGAFSRKMLTDAIKSLRLRDEECAKSVIERKEELSRWHMDIEDRVLRFTALYSPVADDLRTLTCINRINSSSYRIGRMGKDIAKISRSLAKEPLIVPMGSIFHMADIVCGMVEDVLNSFKTGDVETLLQLGERDDMVDDMRSALFREYLTYMMEDSRNIRSGIDCISVSRHLERCGDHACLMAEKIYFMKTGRRVEIR